MVVTAEMMFKSGAKKQQKKAEAKNSEAKGADATEIISVKVTAPFIGDGVEVWVSKDLNFKSPDGAAVFYEPELQALAKKSPKALKLIHAQKLAVPGCKVRQ